MSRMVRRGEVTVNRIGPFRCAAILVAVLGWLLAASPAPAHADLDDYDNTLFVNGRTGPVEVVMRRGTTFRISWSLPPDPIFEGPGLPFPDWEIYFSRTPITCRDTRHSLLYWNYIWRRGEVNVGRREGHWEMDIWRFNRPDSSGGFIREVYVRACQMYVTGGRRSNQVEMRVLYPPTSIPFDFDPAIPFDPTVATYPADRPLITGILNTGIYGPTVVMPGFLIGVTGTRRDFGERPGQVLLQIGAAPYFLTDLDWQSDSIAGRVPLSITGVPYGPAWLVVERADGRVSNSMPITFKPREEVRLIQGGEVRVDSCSNEAAVNWCRSRAYPGDPDAPSFEAYHGSPVTDTDKSGYDEYSVDLAIGWRILEIEFSHGEIEMPVPTARSSIRSGADLHHPDIGVYWNNPRGSVDHHYGFRIYVIGPEGTPHR